MAGMENNRSRRTIINIRRDTMVTQEQIDFFQKNGYVKFGRVLDSDGVEAMRAGLDAIIELELAEGDDSSPEFKYGHDRHGDRLNRGSGHPRAIHQYVNMWKRESHYEAAIHHPLIAGTVRALLRYSRSSSLA